ncbi:MAG: thioredoxin domain-containing protein [Deltaproteobacteria bacterium]|nr:thioredoxin domain-containing protein [Deltaproteobacteria bacterium]
MKQLGDHVKGPPGADLVLVEYSDFQSPYSAEVVDVIDELLKSFGGKLRFVFRHFPQPGVHEYALSGALAAEAAARQKKFWAMYRVLFRNQVALDRETILTFAEDLDLDLSQFEQDLDSELTLRRVQRGVLLGEKQGVNRTPTFFINDVKYEGGTDFESLAGALEDALRGGSKKLVA